MVPRLLKLGISFSLWLADRFSQGFRRLFRLRSQPRIVVLYYHAVTDDERQRFATQMADLVRLAHPLPLDFKDVTSGNTLHVAVSFDDGFASVVRNALPELESRGIPFTVFFPTGSWNERPGWIRSPAHPSWNERVLSQSELVAFAQNPLVTIGSHTIHHPNLTQIPIESATTELVQSKKDLETVLGRPVPLFSFPHGAFNDELLRQSRLAGYEQVFTVEPEFADPSGRSFVVGRIATNPSDWRLEFLLKLQGAYRWQAWLH